MAPLVDNPLIASASLHNPRKSHHPSFYPLKLIIFSPVPLYLHTYIWPFAIIWPIFLRYFLTPDLYEKHIGGSEWTFVWCGTIITVQSLVWLCTHWNVNLRALFTSSKATKVEDAKLIKVLPVTNAGSSDICKIDRDNVRLIGEVMERALLTHVRLVENPMFHSYSKNAVSFTMPRITPSNLLSTQSTPNLNQLSNISRNPEGSLQHPSCLVFNSIMEIILSISRFQRSPNSSRNMPSLLSSFSRFSA